MSKPSQRLIFILALGAALLGSSWIARQRIIASRQAKPVAPVMDPQQAEAERRLVELRNAIIAHPQDPAAHRAMAAFYNEHEIPDKALQEMEIAAELTPQDTKSRLELANARLTLNQLPQAEADYLAVTKSDPKNIDAWEGLTATLFKEKRYLEASYGAQQALKIKKNDPNAHLLLATSLLEYATQFPNSTTHAGELAFAKKELEALSKTFPNRGEIYHRLGRACVALHEKQEAIANLRRAHELLPENRDISLLLAIVYRSSGDNAAALLLVKELAAKKEDGTVYDMLGQLLPLSNEPDKEQAALAAFEKAVRLQPEDSYILERLGSAYQKVRKFDEARAAFEKVTKHNPNRAFAYQQLAAIYNNLKITRSTSALTKKTAGDEKGAQEDLQSAADFGKLSSQAAKIASQMTFNDNQLKQIQALSQQHPDDVNLHLILAGRYADLKQFGPARDEYLTVQKLDPQNKRVQPGLEQLAKMQSGE